MTRESTWYGTSKAEQLRARREVGSFDITCTVVRHQAILLQQQDNPLGGILITSRDEVLSLIEKLQQTADRWDELLARSKGVRP